jgi:type I restriction enzyme S subunit
LSDWVSLPLGDLPIASGKSIYPFEFPDEEFELYSVPSHESGQPEFVKGRDIGSNKQLVLPGTVLLCKINPRINRTWIVGEAGTLRQIASTEWIAFESCEEIDQRFLMLFMQQSCIRDYLSANASGVGGSLMRIKPATLKGVAFRMPGIHAQRKIVEKLEELLSDLDAGVAELKAAQRKLSQYRQSLLSAAMEGALTADWRTIHGSLEETGTELLQRILSERRARWELKQLAKFADQGKLPPKGWQATYAEPATPELSNLSLLPDGWVWATAEQLCEFITKGTTPPKSLDDGSEKTIPFLRVTNLTRTGELNFSERVFVSRSVHGDFLARSVVYPNDVLMNIVGPPLGQVSIVPSDFAEWNINQAIAIFRALEGVLPAFVASYLLSSAAQKWLKLRAKTTAGQTNLTLEVCRDLPVPLPPTREQQAVVEQLDVQLSALSGQLDAVELALKQAGAQRKNLLKIAFTGQLVPQDPSDEPASELLARIYATHVTQRVAGKRGRKAKEAE